jgi:hypothetical protein
MGIHERIDRSQLLGKSAEASREFGSRAVRKLAHERAALHSRTENRFFFFMLHPTPGF